MRQDVILDERAFLPVKIRSNMQSSADILRIEPRTRNSGAAKDEKQEQDWQVNQATPDFDDFSRYSAGFMG